MSLHSDFVTAATTEADAWIAFLVARRVRRTAQLAASDSVVTTTGRPVHGIELERFDTDLFRMILATDDRVGFLRALRAVHQGPMPTTAESSGDLVARWTAQATGAGVPS